MSFCQTPMSCQTRVAKRLPALRRCLAAPLAVVFACGWLLASPLQAQTTTYYLHRETSPITPGAFHLKTVAPDSSALIRASANLKNTAPHIASLGSWDTQAGVPGVAGVIPAGSVMSVTLWMRKTSANGTVFPQATARLNNPSGALFCQAIGGTALTTTLTAYTFTCATGSAITMTGADRLMVFPGYSMTVGPGNKNMEVRLHLEGTADSRFVMPNAATLPSISSLNPTTGAVGQPVTVAGANFGATQGTSTVAFNGVTAAVTSWSAGSVAVTVPPGATTGPVIVTVNGQASNGVAFTVIQPPSLSSLNPTSGPIGQAVTIAGANFGATQGTSVVTFNGVAATATSWSATSIGVTVPAGAATGPVVVTVSGQSSNGIVFTVTTAGTPTSSIQYRYDSLGRLTSVIDRDGNQATYNYDAVGNLLSIARATTSVVTIAGFNPASGFAGATVTIGGSGFSTVPSENIVTVGGKPAVATSSTAIEITITVPLGASSGPISVVTPSGAAVSNGVFTVLGGGALPNQPTITGFTPSAGAAGTSVNINGTNFDPDIADNTVVFNTAMAPVIAATPTTLTVTVPSSASSGRVTVITPSGQVTSATDFVVPPPSHAVGDVELSARMEFGVPTPVSVPQGKVGVYLFEGAADDWINFHLSFPGFFGSQDATLTVLDPAGAVVYTESTFPTHPPLRLLATGTYSVVIDAVDGPAAFDLHVTQDVAETVVISTQSTSRRVTLRHPYQNARIRVVDATGGAFGPRLSVRASDVGPYSTLIALLAADGTELVSDYVLRTEGEPVLLDAPLAPGASLTVLVDPELDEFGSITLELSHPPAAATGSITPGILTPIGTTLPGQNARLLFTGAAGQRVSVKVDRVGDISIFTVIRLIAPSGAVLASGQLNSGMDFLDAVTLPVAGSYVIEIDPPDENVGSVNVMLHDITDLTAAATIGGPAVNFTFTTPGQNGTVTFDGSTGTRVGFLFTGLSGFITLRAPDNSILFGPIVRPTFIDATLTQTGTHTLTFDPNAMNTGAMSVTLSSVPADVTGTIVAGGPALPINITAAGQNAQVTFEAVGGQRVSLQMTSVSIQQSAVTIKRPDGSALATTNVFTSGGFIDTNVLADPGTYTITVDPVREFTGAVTLSLHNVSVDATAGATIGGPPVTVTVGTPGQLGLVTFDGTAGQRVAINLTSVTIGSSNVSLLNPDGSVLIPASSMTTSGKFLDGLLVATGTHTLRIDPVLSLTGSATATLTLVPVDLTSNITIGGPSVPSSIPSAGQRARLTFSASPNQRVSVQLSAVTISSSVVSILRPDDSVLVSATVGTSGGFIDTNVLAIGGTYTLLIDPNGAATGNMTAQLFDVPTDLSGPIAPGGAPVSVAIGSVGQNATLSFTGSVGLRISLRASSVTISSATISILRPNGSTLSSLTVGTGGGFIDTKTLTDAGTFTIKVDPATTATGGLTLTLYQVPLEATSSVVVNGPGSAVAIGTPGQNGAVAFDGTVGQQVTVHVTGNSMGSVTVRLLRPDNTTMTTMTSSLSAFNLTTQTIPITGPYRVTIDPAGSATGTTLTVAVTAP
jgi:YD repeat-containing protein